MAMIRSPRQIARDRLRELTVHERDLFAMLSELNEERPLTREDSQREGQLEAEIHNIENERSQLYPTAYN